MFIVSFVFILPTTTSFSVIISESFDKNITLSFKLFAPFEVFKTSAVNFEISF